MRLEMKTIRYGLNIAAAMVSATVLTATAYSQTPAPTRIKLHNDWGAYSHSGTTGKICYVLSAPKEKRPQDRKHGDVYFMLARHPGATAAIEPQFTVEYPFKDESEVTLNIDGKEFAMFTRGSNAWMKNPDEEQTVVSAMRAGSKMMVSGTSRRGTNTSYDFSLSGVTASFKEIESCS